MKHLGIIGVFVSLVGCSGPQVNLHSQPAPRIEVSADTAVFALRSAQGLDALGKIRDLTSPLSVAYTMKEVFVETTLQSLDSSARACVVGLDLSQAVIKGDLSIRSRGTTVVLWMEDGRAFRSGSYRLEIENQGQVASHVFSWDSGDVNGDGLVNGLDVQAVQTMVNYGFLERLLLYDWADNLFSPDDIGDFVTDVYEQKNYEALKALIPTKSCLE